MTTKETSAPPASKKEQKPPKVEPSASDVDIATFTGEYNSCKSLLSDILISEYSTYFCSDDIRVVSSKARTQYKAYTTQELTDQSTGETNKLTEYSMNVAIDDIISFKIQRSQSESLTSKRVNEGFLNAFELSYYKPSSEPKTRFSIHLKAAPKKVGESITNDDIKMGRCLFYITDNFGNYIFLSLKASGKVPKLYYSFENVHKLSEAARTLDCDADGVVKARTDNPDLIELVFPTKSRYRSFFMKRNESPNLDEMVSMRRIGDKYQSVFTSWNPLPGLVHGTIAYNKLSNTNRASKKNQRKTVAKNVKSNTAAGKAADFIYSEAAVDKKNAEAEDVDESEDDDIDNESEEETEVETCTDTESEEEGGDANDDATAANASRRTAQLDLLMSTDDEDDNDTIEAKPLKGKRRTKVNGPERLKKRRRVIPPIDEDDEM